MIICMHNIFFDVCYLLNVSLVRNATIYTKILAFLVLSFRVKKKIDCPD